MAFLPTSDLEPIVRKLARHSPLDDADIAAFLDLPCRVQRVHAGTVLVRDGDRAIDCCGLLSGFAYRHAMTGDGYRQILSFQMQGDLLDLQNSMLDRADHNLQMLTTGRVAFIASQDVTDLAKARPAIGQALLKEALIDGSIYRGWIMNVGRRNASQRVAHLLCEMAVRQESAGLSTGPDYEWPMTQEQLGDAVGLTSVHVNRTLQRLRSNSLIASARSNLTILDWKGLQRTGDFDRAYLHETVLEYA